VTRPGGTGLPPARCFTENRRQPDNNKRYGGLNMADKTSLGVMGFLFGSITLAVTIIAFLVVRDHLDGRLQLESAAMAPQMVSISTH
jgi:hypothetical protein